MKSLIRNFETMSNKPIILSKSDATHKIMTAKSKSSITSAEISDKIGKNKVINLFFKYKLISEISAKL